MILARRLAVATAGTMLCIAIPIALYASPGGAADPTVRPVPTGRVSRTPTPVRARPSTASDTVIKGEKGRTERVSPASRKKLLKGRQVAPAPTSDPRQFVPDQPWETEFLVDNGATQPPWQPILLLASARR